MFNSPKNNSMIDKATFKENFQYFDNELVVEIIDIFLNEYEERLAQIEDDFNKPDFISLKFNAHSYKGVVANFYDPEITDSSKDLDKYAKQLSAALSAKLDKPEEHLSKMDKEELVRISMSLLSEEKETVTKAKGTFSQLKELTLLLAEELNELRKAYLAS